MLFFKKCKKCEPAFKSATAFDVVVNAALFFHGLQSRYGMDSELVRLSKKAVEVCSAICKRLKEIEK